MTGLWTIAGIILGWALVQASFFLHDYRERKRRP